MKDGEVMGGEGKEKLKAGEIWAVALSEEGRYLAGTSADGKIGVWDLEAGTSGEGRGQKIREYETKGSFGMCVDMVRVNSLVSIDVAHQLAISRRMDDLQPVHTRAATSISSAMIRAACCIRCQGWSNQSVQSLFHLVENSWLLRAMRGS